jgi:hypothetical protein
MSKLPFLYFPLFLFSFFSSPCPPNLLIRFPMGSHHLSSLPHLLQAPRFCLGPRHARRRRAPLRLALRCAPALASDRPLH